MTRIVLDFALRIWEPEITSILILSEEAASYKSNVELILIKNGFIQNSQ